jgi:hypothetical protein
MASFGKFEIIEQIGEGGMGTVYKAHQTGLDRIVALKVMNPALAGKTAFARFQREARVLDSLRHSNIVRLLTLGYHKHRIYLAMDYIDGSSLETLMWTRRSDSFCAPTTGEQRALRGGSWRHCSRDCHSASRHAADPTKRSTNFGFRVVLHMRGVNGGQRRR